MIQCYPFHNADKQVLTPRGERDGKEGQEDLIKTITDYGRAMRSFQDPPGSQTSFVINYRVLACVLPEEEEDITSSQPHQAD